MTVPPSLAAPAPTRGRTRARLIAVATALVALVVLRMASVVVVPLVAGLLLAALAWPIVRALRPRIPGRLAVALAFLALLAGVLAFLAALAWAGGTVAEDAPRIRERLEEVRARVAPTAAKLGIALPGGDAATGANAGAGNGNGLARRVLGALEATFTGIVLTLAFAGLALAEVRAVRARIVGRLGARGERLVATLARTAHALREFAWIKTVTSLITGVATAALAFALGIEHALVWGFLAFLLEYVPGVGSLLAVLPPSLMALVQFGPSARALAAFLAFGALQLFLGNFVDPRIEGRRLAISPFVVLLSIVFWAWVWGPAGALLGVPATLAIVVACREVPHLRWVDVLLATDDGGGGDGDPHGDDGTLGERAPGPAARARR